MVATREQQNELRPDLHSLPFVKERTGHCCAPGKGAESQNGNRPLVYRGCKLMKKCASRVVIVTSISVPLLNSIALEGAGVCVCGGEVAAVPWHVCSTLTTDCNYCMLAVLEYQTV